MYSFVAGNCTSFDTEWTQYNTLNLAERAVCRSLCGAGRSRIMEMVNNAQSSPCGENASLECTRSIDSKLYGLFSNTFQKIKVQRAKSS
jgi:hypothetical protein